MARPRQGLLHNRRPFLISIALITAAVVGWLTAQSLAPKASADGNHKRLDAEVQLLLARQQQDDLNPAEQRRLLERLIVLERPEQALGLLQQLSNQEPKALIWPLMIAEFKRFEGDLDGARQEINRLLTLHPQKLEVLELKALLELDSGRGSAVVGLLKATFNSQPRGQRLTTGLLLADVQRQSGQTEKAAALYNALAAESPNDARPLIALALLRQEQGMGKKAQLLLFRARQRRTKPGEADPMIDSLAAHWGLLSARKVVSRTSQQTSAEAAAATAQRKSHRSHRP
ncbi:MAG: tetratricopeptide repeat protein [Prochlorococcus sp.]|nr:hypothetical protein [Prochlorococcaceae cyanobacterium Fu_MAG_50]